MGDIPTNLVENNTTGGSRYPTLTPLWCLLATETMKDLCNMPTFVRRLCNFVLAPIHDKFY
jgi:hypothetical protein